MEIRTIMTVFMTLIVLGAMGVIGYEIYNTFIASKSGASAVAPENQSVQLLTSLTDGSKSQTLTAQIPQSVNQNKGIEYSYSFWFYVTDPTVNQGNARTLFTKGDSTNSSPAVYMDANTNTLHIKQDLFDGSSMDVPIQSIPNNILIHVVVNVTQTTMTVYVDGILKEYRMLPALPKQNNGSVIVGSSGGFGGFVGPITYYNYELSQDSIVQLVQQPPPPPPAPNISAPPYFDAQWYVSN